MKSFCRSSWILQPILIALFPALHMCANNATYISSLHLFFAILTITISTLFFVFLFSFIYKNFIKSLIVTNILILLFYGLKFTMELIRESLAQNLGAFRNAIVLLFAIFFLLIFYFIYKISKITITRTFFLKIAIFPFLFLNGLALYTFTTKKINLREVSKTYEQETKKLETKLVKQIPRIKQKITYFPDIYFIILDAYAANSSLIKIFSFDNSPFLKKLREIGFYIADKSKSNYSMTHPSLITTLSMQYLSSKALAIAYDDIVPDNTAKNFLDQLGYTYIDLSIHACDALSLFYDDNYFKMKQKRDRVWGEFKRFLFGQHFFTKAFFESMTPLYPIVKKLHIKVRRDTLLRKLDLLKKARSLTKKPKFVYLHIYAPHPPYSFDEDGNQYPHRKSNQEKVAYEKIGYVQAIKFLNKKIYSLLEQIINESPQPPVIILQGDHGSRFPNDGFPMLNAWYLPNDGTKLLYQSISPVNNFRVIFNHYFDTKLPLLKDVSGAEIQKSLRSSLQKRS